MKSNPLGLSALLCFCLLHTSPITGIGMSWGQNQKAGQESCDGVLDVVPAKAMSFVRKRRPSKETNSVTPSITPTPTDKSPKTTHKKVIR